MKAKIVGGLICALLVLSMLSVKTSYESSLEYAVNSKTIHMSTLTEPLDEATDFPYTIVEENKKYVRLILDDSSTFLQHPGKPLIPTVVQHVELPFRVTNLQVKVDVPAYHQRTIGKAIVPASNPVLYTLSCPTVTGSYKRDEKVYGSNQPYPSRWFTYHVGCGLNENNKMYSLR